MEIPRSDSQRNFIKRFFGKNCGGTPEIPEEPIKRVGPNGDGCIISVIKLPL
jgi:hypothetical protein